MIRLAEDYLDGADFEISELDSAEEVEEQIPSRDLHSKAVWCIARLQNCGWLEDLEIGYEDDARTAICPQVVPILQAFYSVIHPQNSGSNQDFGTTKAAKMYFSLSDPGPNAFAVNPVNPPKFSN